MNETHTEIPTYGGLEVQTLEDLMDAIASIVTIGMSGGPRATVRHLSFTRVWADRLAALADREPNRIPFGVLLRIDAREVARELAPRWSLSSEADFRRGIELLQQHRARKPLFSYVSPLLVAPLNSSAFGPSKTSCHDCPFAGRGRCLRLMSCAERVAPGSGFTSGRTSLLDNPSRREPHQPV